MSERVVNIHIQDADDGAYISIRGEMRLVEMLAVSLMLLKKSVEKGTELGGSVSILQDLLDTVKRRVDQDFPGTITDVKN